MLPLTQCPIDTLRSIKVVFTDIDDTLTTEGRLEAIAYGAMEKLQRAGITVVPVTGRPAGWCDMIARFWPVAGVIGENGAFYFRYDHQNKNMARVYWQDDATRAANRAKLQTLEAEILAAVPGAAVSADQAYRESDLAIDFCEDVPPLGRTDIDRIVAIFETAGAVAKVSSIHVNGWFGEFDKLFMTRRFIADLGMGSFGDVIERAAFIGDSPNDAPMFAAFPHSVGVANVADVQDRMNHLPRWITQDRGGKGFAELADLLITTRKR